MFNECPLLPRFDSSGSSLSRVRGPPGPPPGAEQLDAQTGEVVEQLQVEALLEAVHEAVLWVQTEAHGPQDLRALLAQVVESVHQLIQVRMAIDHVSRQNVVEAVGGARETLLHLLTPDQLGDLQSKTVQYSTGYLISHCLSTCTGIKDEICVTAP